MRNLKRALSLVMASVMLLGMMVVGTSAASFGDVDSSNDLEAIEVMNAVGVMQGDERGFRPNDPINRNEIAKVMALLLNLTPEDYAYAVTPFVDVPEWAAPYVAACYANGITNGTSANTYSGANNVTAIQAARMMLRALGYLKNPEDDGDDWVLATATQASKIGLFNGVNQTGVHAALTRGQVATMALNALESNMVEDHSSKGLQVDTPDGTKVSVGYTPDYRKISISNEGDKNYATPAGGNNPNDDGYGYQQLCEYLYGTDLKKTGSSTNEFGRPGATWKYKGKELVGSAKNPLIVYTAKASTSTVEKDLRGYVVGTGTGNPTYKINADTTAAVSIVATDGKSGVLNMRNSDGTASTPGSKIAGLTRGGSRVEVYASDDIIDCIVVINTYVAKVSSVKDNEDGTYDVTMNIRRRDANLTDNTIEVRDGSYAKGDIVLVTADVNDNELKSIQKADVITGKVTALKVDGNGTYIKLDGNQYFTSQMFYNYDLGGSNLPAVSDELTAYVKDGVVYGLDEVVDAVKDYLYVIDAVPGLGSAEAKVAFSDGTQAKVDVVKLGNDKYGTTGVFDKATLNIAGKVYTYSEDGGDYSLTTVAGYTTPAPVAPATKPIGKIENGSASVTVAASNDVTATTKTVFVDVDGKKAYTGYLSVPDVSNAKLVSGGKTAGLAEIIYIVSGDLTDKDSSIFYVRGNKYELAELSGGAELRTYDVYENGAKIRKTTKDMKEATPGNDDSETYILQKDTVYYSKVVNSDGYLTKIKNGGSGLSGNAQAANSKLSFTVPSYMFGTVGTNKGNVKTAEGGVLELVSSPITYGGQTYAAGTFDKSWSTSGKSTFTYDGDTIFLVVTANDAGNEGDDVSWGDIGNIVVRGDYKAAGDQAESIVFVLEVDDASVSTPKATLVLVIQPK